MNRRSLLKLGASGAFLLAAGGLIASLTGRNARQDRESVLRALVPAMLGGALPGAGPQRDAAIERAVESVAIAIGGLAPTAQAEIGQLFALLAAPPTRLALAGLAQGWEQASEQQVSAVLQRWRIHRLPLLQSGYQALHDLIAGSWYGHESTWRAIGYGGPVQL